jgi:hypothetical protein
MLCLMVAPASADCVNGVCSINDRPAKHVAAKVANFSQRKEAPAESSAKRCGPLRRLMGRCK